jgi:hypothetical protein
LPGKVTRQSSSIGSEFGVTFTRASSLPMVSLAYGWHCRGVVPLFVMAH